MIRIQIVTVSRIGRTNEDAKIIEAQNSTELTGQMEMHNCFAKRDNNPWVQGSTRESLHRLAGVVVRYRVQLLRFNKERDNLQFQTRMDEDRVAVLMGTVIGKVGTMGLEPRYLETGVRSLLTYQCVPETWELRRVDRTLLRPVHLVSITQAYIPHVNMTN